MTSRKIIGIGGTVVAIPLLLFACGILKVEGPVRGQVVDADTNAPVPGAAIVLNQRAICPRFFHGVRRYPYPRLETQTDSEGYFRVGGGIKFVPYCAFPFWNASLNVFAPGYFLKSIRFDEVLTHGDNPVRAGVFELDRIRYLIELEEYRRLSKRRREKEDKSLWGQAKNVAQHLSFRRVGEPGVFASQPGAILDQIVTIEAWSWDAPRLSRWSVFTQDRNTGSVYRWKRNGTPEAVHPPPTPEAVMVGGHRPRGTYPFFIQESRIYYPHVRAVKHSGHVEMDWLFGTSQFGGIRVAADSGGYVLTVEDEGRELAIYRWDSPTIKEPYRPPRMVPGRRRKVSEILPGGTPPIECIAAVKGVDRLMYFVLITHTADGRAMFILPFRWVHEDRPAERVDLPRGTRDAEVTACAGGFKSLYVAIKDRGIIRLEGLNALSWKEPWKVTHTRTFAGPDGPINFTALAVGEFNPFWQMLYAVAGDDKIYRFDADLRPDQRIEFDLESLPPDHPTR